MDLSEQQARLLLLAAAAKGDELIPLDYHLDGDLNAAYNAGFNMLQPGEGWQLAALVYQICQNVAAQGDVRSQLRREAVLSCLAGYQAARAKAGMPPLKEGGEWDDILNINTWAETSIDVVAGPHTVSGVLKRTKLNLKKGKINSEQQWTTRP